MPQWRKHFFQFFSAHGVNDARQTAIHTAERLEPEPSAIQFEMVIEKLKRLKSPGIDQIPAELIRAGGRTIRSKIHKLLSRFEMRRNCLSNGRSLSLYLFIRRAIKHVVVIIEAYNFCSLRTKFYSTSCFQE
jgi:hypothetical protein